MAPRSSRSLLALVTPLLLCFLAGMALAGQPVLSPGERQWLASLNRDIRIGITVIPPQIVHDGGTYEGLSLDYIRLMERKLDHRFKLVPLPTWNDVIEAARERRIDIIFAAQKTPERLAYLDFTEPYIDLPNIILTRKDRAGAEDLQIMNEWSIAISKGSAVHEYLQKEFPHLDLRPVPDELKGLQQVSLGEVDAMVLEISRASYYIEKEGILNLRVAGDAQYLYQLRFAVRNDWPLLHNILDKGLAAIDDEERRDINRRWIIVGRQSIFANRTFLIAFSIGLAVIALTVTGVATWNFTLRRVVRQRTSQLQQELTERERIEGALRESENKFKGFAEQALVGVCLAQDGVFKYVNPKFADMFGYTVEELADDMPLGKVVHAEDLPMVEENLRKRISGEISSVRCSFRGLKKDGRIFFGEIYGTRIIYQGKPAGLGTILDITDRKRDEEKIKRDELRLRHLVDILQHPSETIQEFLDYSLEQAIQLTESTLGFIFHYYEERGEFVLTSWSKAALPACTAAKPQSDELSATGLLRETVRRRQPIIDNDFLAARPQQAECPESHVQLIRVATAPIFQGERIVGVIELANKDSDYEQTDVLQVSLLMDAVWKVIEKMRAEEEQNRISLQLEQARKMESIGTLAGGIAHDFNNILSAILGYAEMAREDCIPGSTMATDLDQVILASNRAKVLTQQILAFSRQSQNEKTPHNPAFIAREAIKLLRSSLPTTIRIEQNIDTDAGLILADPTEIHQVLMNLCTNAFHAMEDTGGVLSIGLRKVSLPRQEQAGNGNETSDDYIELSVKDTGAGIPQEIRERIFEPYFTTKEMGKGTGMGLAIVHGIIKNYGGEITCRSEMGQGTQFNIVLPMYAGKIVHGSKPIDTMQTGTEHVLLLDDEEILVEMARNMLERMGYKVTTRTSSLEALTTFENQPGAFDIVITDQTMPGMTGIDLARRMLQIRPDLPVILCTGYSSQISEEKAKSFGIQGFAMKPLSKKELGDLIRTVLDSNGVVRFRPR